MKIVKIALFWLLHIVLVVLSLLLAVVLGTVYWFIWLLNLPFKQSQSQVQAELPEPDDLSSEISLETLLGSGAPRKIDGVFEGGGVKALAQIGAIQAIERLQLDWSKVGGTSGGAIMAAVLAAGKGSQEMWDILTKVGLHRFVDVWYLPEVEFLQKRLYFYAPLLAHLVFTKGLVSGRVFLETMRGILLRGGQELRFRDLLDSDWSPGSYASRHSLQMVATDISRGTPIVLPDDVPAYWEAWERKTLPPNAVDPLKKEDAQDWWSVADAVRMSMSIPFFFKPVKLHLNVEKDGRTVKTDGRGQKGQPVLIVDGGPSSNFPIWLFDRLDKVPEWPTFGFLLDETKGIPAQHARITGLLIDLAVSLISTGMGARDKRLSLHDAYRTARLSTRFQTKAGTKEVKTTDFGLSPEEQAALVRSGFLNTVDFLKGFNWIDYLEQFRK